MPERATSLHDDKKGGHRHPLLTEFKDGTEQFGLNRLQLANQTSMGGLILALNQGNYWITPPWCVAASST